MTEIMISSDSCVIFVPARTIVFLVVWTFLVPGASALLSHDVVNEKIGQSLTAWVDRKFRGSLVAFLFRCEVCMVHWFVLLFAAVMFREWTALPVDGPIMKMFITAAFVLKAIRDGKECLKQQ